MVDSPNEVINVDDINYAIYKIGMWNNDYEINQVGLSSEIPVTKNTVEHVKFSMDEIRRAEFEINGVIVNGFVAIAYQMNPKIRNNDINVAIELEKKEYEAILEELADLTVIDDNETIPLESDDYLIYKLEKECHVTQSIPANKYTLEHYKNEMKRIDESII